ASAAEFAEALDEIEAARHGRSTVPVRVTRRASVAVLPFANLSKDPADEFFSDGISDELTQQLEKVDGLDVFARASAFAFKGHTDLREIANTLGVTHSLKGGAQRIGERVHILAELAAARDGIAIWSEGYDRLMDQLGAVRDDIIRNVSGRLTQDAQPEG